MCHRGTRKILIKKKKKKKRQKSVLDALPALSRQVKKLRLGDGASFFLPTFLLQMQRCCGNIGMHGPFKSRRAATGLVTGWAGPHVWGDQWLLQGADSDSRPAGMVFDGGF
jgi:hypothetical protein